MMRALLIKTGLLVCGVVHLAGCATTAGDSVATVIPAAAATRVVEAGPPDADGRQLYDAPHNMDPVMMDELRANVPKFEGLNNKGIMRHMHNMGPNYTWYVSDAAVQNDYGVLILAHGFREHGDRVMSQRIAPLAGQAPTAMAMGMSMMTSDHIQLAINNLEAAGAKRVIIVPAVTTRNSSMPRQWDYVFGLSDQPTYATVPRVSADIDLYIVPPLEDHPLVGETLLEYAAEISADPANEDVIILAHGPEGEADNLVQLAMLERLADYMRERADYHSITVATLQDDAKPEIRAANVAYLRRRITASARAGRQTLIVSNLLGTRMVQSKLRRDLRGLDYRFNRKGLIQHDNFIRWIETSVDGVVASLP